jgi:hypothetical protein
MTAVRTKTDQLIRKNIKTREEKKSLDQLTLSRSALATWIDPESFLDLYFSDTQSQDAFAFAEALNPNLDCSELFGRVACFLRYITVGLSISLLGLQRFDIWPCDYQMIMN